MFVWKKRFPLVQFVAEHLTRFDLFHFNNKKKNFWQMVNCTVKTLQIFRWYSFVWFQRKGKKNLIQSYENAPIPSENKTSSHTTKSPPKTSITERLQTVLNPIHKATFAYTFYMLMVNIVMVCRYDYHWSVHGLTCLDFWVRTCGLSPRSPSHSYSRLSEKTWHIHILDKAKMVPIHILFFTFYLFIYFLSKNDTLLTYFWSEKHPHSYTWRP